jgi:hypothetical protein
VKANYPAERERKKHSMDGLGLPGAGKSALEDSDAERTAYFQNIYDNMSPFTFFGSYTDVLVVDEANKTISDFLGAKLRERVKDPATAEKLIPKSYPFGTRRTCLDMGYYEIYNQPNVHLVDLLESPMKTITPTGFSTEAGDSAGGGLALSLLLKLKAAGKAQPAAAVLLSPWADLTHSGATMTTKKDVDNSLSQVGLQAGADQYLGSTKATDPLASPLFGDYAGIAPMLIEVGSEEILLADSTRLAAIAGEAKVDVTLHVWPEMPHDWSLFSFMLSEGRDMIAEVGTWVSARLGR